jgi:translation factor GUF1, mitochondrial
MLLRRKVWSSPAAAAALAIRRRAVHSLVSPNATPLPASSVGVRRRVFSTQGGGSGGGAAPVDLLEFPPATIRNFSVIAHIDHGKTTLSNELLRLTGTTGMIKGDSEGVLDALQVEQERGITVKARATSMVYDESEHGSGDRRFMFNLIDTPGHVDFHYEVSRALAACQGALLVVDATQGVQAQTVANFYAALEANLEVIPVVNKIDVSTADVPKVLQELKDSFDFHPDSVICVSARTGMNVDAILPAIAARVPAPAASEPTAPLRVLLFDSFFDKFRGVICLVEVIDGMVKVGDTIVTASSLSGKGAATYEVGELGLMHPHRSPTQFLGPGQVGYIICGMRDTAQARAGDTIFRSGTPVAPLPGFREARAALYAGLYPSDPNDLIKLTDAVEKLRLTDAAISIQKESSDALGTGFRVGFMGLLHMDVFSQRLAHEHQMDVINTAPTVPYVVVMRDPGGGPNKEILVTRPSAYAEYCEEPKSKHWVEEVREPIVLGTILIPEEYLGAVMQLCHDRRAEQVDCVWLDGSPPRVRLRWRIPASEVITNFVDRLKQLTSGYAVFEYEDAGYEPVSLSRLRILLNGEECEPLSTLVPKDRVLREGRSITAKLKELIPRQMFQVAIQAAVGTKILARETVKPLRKNVTAKCYGGDVTRKRKLLEKQKEGKKRMRAFGNVELSADTFVAVLKRD